MPYLLLFALIAYCAYSIITYRKTNYYKITHNSFLSVRFDKGRRGEYLTYKYLRNLEKGGSRFLFNIYLPKGNGETTEIDVMLIDNDGVFVFESKNYSGWIFGSETQKNWTQCLPQGKGRTSQKEHFLNPIFQNKLHISTLKQILGENFPFYSIITFSERCTLKNISVSDPMTCVINRNQVSAAVKSLSSANASKLSQEEIDRIYDSLLPFTQVSDEVKEKHINDIQSNHLETVSDTLSVKETPLPTSDLSEKVETTKERSSTDFTCPVCGGTLILRTASHGSNKGNQFYGCSNYPKCHYIKNI